jgi:hypothetical protein
MLKVVSLSKKLSPAQEEFWRMVREIMQAFRRPTEQQVLAELAEWGVRPPDMPPTPPSPTSGKRLASPAPISLNCTQAKRESK